MIGISIGVAYAAFLLSAVSVYFLVRSAVVVVPPMVLSGTRLAVAGIVLVLFAAAFGATPTIDSETWWRYVIVGLLAIAVPHALLFFAMRGAQVDEGTAAFFEGTIPGIMVILIFLEGLPFRSPFATTACIVVAIASLAVFVGFRLTNPRRFFSLEYLFITISAVTTAVGLLAYDLIPKVPVATIHDKWLQSLGTTAYVTSVAGVATLLCAFVCREPMARTRQAWYFIIALALVGTCIGWVALFVLLSADRIIGASAVVAVVPATLVVVHLRGGRRLCTRQWWSAVFLIGSLATLIYIRS